MDSKIVSHTTHNQHIVKYIFRNNSVDIEAKNANLLSSDSSRRDESNEPKFIKFQSLDSLKTGICRITNFENTSEIRNFGQNLHINFTQTQCELYERYLGSSLYHTI